MRYLVIGLGSMGRRRIRCLMELGENKIAGFDYQSSRVDAATNDGIETYSKFDEAVQDFRPDVLIISTPPKYHLEYAYISVKLGLSCFIEASVVDGEQLLELEDVARKNGVVCFPSCTMKYFKGPQTIKQIVESGILGQILTVNYQTGQYLPDWHPWESVHDYYVSERATGGCREIVPFELTWINDLFGIPEPIFCNKSKISDLDVDIDDVYHILLKYPRGELVNIVVEVLSRPLASRDMRIVGSNGRLVFDGENSLVRYATTENPEWHLIDVSEVGNHQGSINPEGPYIREIADFVSAISTNDPTMFPNCLLRDSQVLETLYKLEQISVNY